MFAGHYPWFVTELIKPDLTITMLREPVDRVLSTLRQIKRTQKAFADYPLEQIYDESWSGVLLTRNYQARLFAMTADDEPADLAHLTPIEIDDVRLARAQRNLEQTDVVGFQHRYEDFLAELTERCHWRFPARYRERVGEDAPPVSASFRRRIAADNEASIELFRVASASYDRRSRSLL